MFLGFIYNIELKKVDEKTDRSLATKACERPITQHPFQ